LWFSTYRTQNVKKKLYLLEKRMRVHKRDHHLRDKFTEHLEKIQKTLMIKLTRWFVYLMKGLESVRSRRSQTIQKNGCSSNLIPQSLGTKSCVSKAQSYIL